MGITLYYTAGSPPCTQVLLTARALNVDLELKSLDLFNREHIDPEFLKINPQHTVPTLVDGDFTLWESRTIARYLAAKHGSTLYPQDLKARAVVDQRLDFDIGTLHPRFVEYFYPQYYENKPPQEAKLMRLQEALSVLNTFLAGSQYVAGADLTIADFAIVATVATLNAAGVDLGPYPNIERWFELFSSTAGYREVIKPNIEVMKSIMEKVKNGTINK